MWCCAWSNPIFYNLLPKDDKEKLENLDYFLIDLIKNDTDLSIESLSQYEELQLFMGWILLIKSLKNLETTRWESGKTNRVFTNVWWWS
jgi:hypothetical protein